MRLSSIKLSGFKSFVDLTQFEFHGQIVGVVGPNGCGKSNLIDAVRWVLGESKASELRGESMADVIFNGSTGRSAAGRASVELVFDNSLGRMTGQWSQYTEIAVKRVVTRDGLSSYYINNQGVRRRDIQEMFMGTGLGPRAYAIIGQGMVARIVEARPEELRIFLEEAAGISKYKERRRETETRLSDTRDNLARVQDILSEINQQSQKLKTQAAKAERYQNVQAQLGKTKKIAALSGLDDSRVQADAAQQVVEQQKTKLEAQRQALSAQENQVLHLRLSGQTALDALNQAQTTLFQTNAQITQLEARLRYLRETRQRLVSQQADSASDIERLQSTMAQHQTELAAAELAVQEAQEGLATQTQEINARQEAFAAANAVLLAAQQAERQGREQVSQLQKELAVHSANLSSLQLQEKNNQLAQQQMQQQLARLPTAASEHLAVQEDNLKQLATLLNSDRQSIDQLQEQILAQEKIAGELARQKDVCYSESARLEARHHSLTELQKKLVSSGQLAQWLKQSGLQDQLGVWQQISVKSGWETALEAVLRERLNGRAVKNLQEVLAFAAQALPSKLSFYHLAEGAVPSAASAKESLATQVQTPHVGLFTVLQQWLSGVRCASDLRTALNTRAQLAEGEVWVTPEGHLVDRHSVRLYRADSVEEGLLKRQQEIGAIEKSQRAQKIQLDAATSAWTHASEQLTELRKNLQALQKKYQALLQQQQQLQTQHREERERQLQQQLQRDTATTEIGRIARVLTALTQQISEAGALVGATERRCKEAQTQLDSAVTASADQMNHSEVARSQLQAAQLALQQQGFRREQANTRLSQIKQTIALAQQQLVNLTTRQEQMSKELAALTQDSEEGQLTNLLATRTQCEQALQQARNNSDGLVAALRQADELRLSLSLAIAPIQEQLSAAQLEAQAAQMRCAQYQLDLSDLTDSFEAALRSEFPQWPNLADSVEKIKKFERQLLEMGAVNLAAPEELAEVEKRCTFLQAQLDDLNTAMSTLSKAISEIDIETRGLLQATFDTVNQHFGVLFPRLFGGGTAKLVMTGNEILDAGLQVMAQPPGKKNSTIHLLSGGEKTLTAITLIFALFQLNPAPFCLLDEVDAPLDDANTERFCQLVAEMSSNTQFVFVTHNKIAMEMAQHLIGVTMQEQGVSRIVSVDLESFAAQTQ